MLDDTVSNPGQYEIRDLLLSQWNSGFFGKEKATSKQHRLIGSDMVRVPLLVAIWEGPYQAFFLAQEGLLPG